MSIIHDALKKAERERTPLPYGVPALRPIASRPGPWRGQGWARLLWGMMIGGGIGAALWLELGGGLSLGRFPPSSAPAVHQDDEGRTQGVDTPAPQVTALEELQVTSPLSAPHHTPTPVPQSWPMDSTATPTNAQALFEQAVNAEAEGLWDEAVGYYRQSLARDPTLLKAHNNLGNLYIRQQRFSEAVTQFQAALTLAPEYAYARNNLGSAYLLMGQEAEAIQEFLAALRLDGSYVSPYYNLAAIYARRGDLAHVVAFLTKAIALEPEVLAWIGQDVDFEGMRAAPAFQQLGRLHHARR